jgi:transposase
MQEQVTLLNFEGQNIYVGMDVHKKSWTVSVMMEDVDIILKTFSQPPDADALYRYLISHYPGAKYHTVYEAGFCGFWPHYKLSELGINSMVVNAADVPTNQKEKTQKDDPRDSRKLVRSLRGGVLTGIHVPDKSALSDRSLVRTRWTIVKDMVRCKLRIKSFLYFYGIDYPKEFSSSTTHWSKRFVKWLRGIILPDVTAIESLNSMIDQLESGRGHLLEITRKVRTLSKSEKYQQNMILLGTVPGIGMITSITLLTELGDINRFKDTDHLAAYIGLVPTCHSSGEKEHKGEMTFRQNGHLLQMLIESSWCAVREDPAMSLCYSKHVKRMEKNKAIIRVARKLLNRIYGILKEKKEYKCGINNV